MITTETYQISPEWGTLSKPLEQRLAHQNGFEHALLDRLHAVGYTQFKDVGVPGRKNEDWKYTPLRELIKPQYQNAPVPEGDLSVISRYKSQVDATTLVFQNGHFLQEFSDIMPEGLTIGALSEFIQRPKYTDQITKLIGLLEKSVMTPFEALVTSATPAGLLIDIASGVKLTRPLHVIYLTDEAGIDALYAYPYKLILLGQGAEGEMIESFIGRTNAQLSLTNCVNHVLLDEGANFRHYRLQTENQQSYHINATRVFQERDSTYTSLAVELGSRLMRNNIEAVHLGSNITTNLFGLFHGIGRQHLDTQSFIDHALPHCESHELYKGVLDDASRGVFNGKILVRQDAQKTNAFQQNNTLVLSDKAVMDSKPQLEIYADDVKCSHGATIGQLDEDSVFYLRTRGLTRHEASVMLQRAFVGEVIDKCQNEEIRAYLWDQMHTERHV